jgi:two-component system, NtrC family, sensor histidine kinase HydH
MAVALRWTLDNHFGARSPATSADCRHRGSQARQRSAAPIAAVYADTQGYAFHCACWVRVAMTFENIIRVVGSDSAGKKPRQPFNLLRWFSLLSLVTIFVTGAAMAGFVTRYLTRHMLQRDAEVSREFIESIINTEYARLGTGTKPKELSEIQDRLVEHISKLPDVVRANLYGSDRVVIWSSEHRLIGQRFDKNHELETALRGDIVVETAENKPEHVWLFESGDMEGARRFVEAYLPIRDQAGQHVVAVAEIYKTPHALFEAIDRGVRLVWTSAAVGGIALYVALFWVVRRADQIMHQQRARIVEAETMAAIGEMAASVAHSIRNPLASIRSAAELAQEEEGDVLKECLSNITDQADRIDGWVRGLLTASRDSALPVEQLDLNAIISETLEGAAIEMQRRGIELAVHAGLLPCIRGTRLPLSHAVRSVVSNAVEAMPQGGKLRVVSRSTDAGFVEIIFEDSGPGIPPRLTDRAFSPLFTTKPNGLGLGLTLSRLIVERHAGRIALESAEGRGTRVVLSLPAGGG